jgi:hypothetical protein
MPLVATFRTDWFRVITDLTRKISPLSKSPMNLAFQNPPSSAGNLDQSLAMVTVKR